MLLPDSFANAEFGINVINKIKIIFFTKETYQSFKVMSNVLFFNYSFVYMPNYNQYGGC